MSLAAAAAAWAAQQHKANIIVALNHCRHLRLRPLAVVGMKCYRWVVLCCDVMWCFMVGWAALRC